MAPLAYMRGRTLDNAFIILDEAQNTTQAQMKMFLTRIGFGSKVIITGDQSQKDLPAGQATLDFLTWVVESDEGRDMLANEMGFITPFKTFDEYLPENPLVKAYDEYEGREKPERRSRGEHQKDGREGREQR